MNIYNEPPIHRHTHKDTAQTQHTNISKHTRTYIFFITHKYMFNTHRHTQTHTNVHTSTHDINIYDNPHTHTYTQHIHIY